MLSNYKLIVVGDVGAMTIDLAAYTIDIDPNGERRNIIHRRSYSSNTYPGGLEGALVQFLKEITLSACIAVSLGVPGPVSNGECKTPRIIQADFIATVLKSEFCIDVPVFLLNNSLALAYAVPLLQPQHLHTLNVGSPMPGNKALLSAGSGLEQAGLFYNESTNTYLPWACAGGHPDYAPPSYDPEAQGLYRHLCAIYMGSPVSWEMVLSEPGLCNIMDFFVTTGTWYKKLLPISIRRKAFTPRWYREASDKAASISQAALAGDPLALRVISLFIRLYGAEAGNLAIKVMANGGVYIGGGIAPKILELIRTRFEDFHTAFTQKGKNAWCHDLLGRMLIHIITTDEAALLGALGFALEKLSQLAAVA